MDVEAKRLNNPKNLVLVLKNKNNSDDHINKKLSFFNNKKTYGNAKNKADIPSNKEVAKTTGKYLFAFDFTMFSLEIEDN